MMGTYEEIAERMRIVGLLKNDSAIARVLEITPQALSNYKKRNAMPTSLVVKFAEINDCSLDYLFKGIGEVRGLAEETPEKAPAIDMPLIAGDTSINQLIRAYHSIGYKLKPLEIEPLTEVEKHQIDLQMGRDTKAPEDRDSTKAEDKAADPTPEKKAETTEEEPTAELLLKEALDDAGEPSETEKMPEATVAKEDIPSEDDGSEKVEH